jgi:hypothetical protein
MCKAFYGFACFDVFAIPRYGFAIGLNTDAVRTSMTWFPGGSEYFLFLFDTYIAFAKAYQL